ncbi:MAG: ribonuclease P protein subunit [Natrialbaceae archaeon]|nr:ribonuclease P protein subunit [Natrialbaceae archaeon]
MAERRADPGRVGIAGVVGRETTNTLVIDDPDGDRSWTVPKAEATFAFTLPEEDEPIHVEGERLVDRRPAPTLGAWR